MESGTKHFRKRSAILEYLQGTKAHPSAEMVYSDLKRQIPDLSMGTVYRNLNLFRQQGLAAVIATVRGVERFDANTAPHVHFICDDCGAVIDMMEMQIPEALSEQARLMTGGTVESCQLSFNGRCGDCVKSTKVS